MIGVEFMTRENAVSLTANVAAFRDFPRLLGSPLLSSLLCSASAGKMSMPCLISSPLMRKTFKAPADATAAKGISLLNVVLAVGLSRFNLGTTAFKPNATPHDADTARAYDVTSVSVLRGDVLLALL